MEDINKENVKKLFSLIQESKYPVALTGAGVSTLSGIRDFRGKNGLYNEMDADKIFSIDYFEKDPSFITVRQVHLFIILMKKNHQLFTLYLENLRNEDTLRR